jgi:hypothetical protein
MLLNLDTCLASCAVELGLPSLTHHPTEEDTSDVVLILHCMLGVHSCVKWKNNEVSNDCFKFLTNEISGLGGLGVACWPLVPKFAGSNPAEAVRFLSAKKILSTPSFGGEVKPSVPCRRFSACKRTLNGMEVVISAKLLDNNLAHSSTFCRWDLSRHGGRGGTWWRKLERLNAGESNGKLPLRIRLGCSVPEPYQSPDWARVSALTGPRAEYLQ